MKIILMKPSERFPKCSSAGNFTLNQTRIVFNTKRFSLEGPLEMTYVKAQ